MATATKSRRFTSFTTEITQADEKLLGLAAALEGLSVADFVLGKARAAAAEAIRRCRSIRLNVDQSHRFVQALLSPPRPANRRMRNALALHSATVTER